MKDAGRRDLVLTAQVVAEALETLPFIGRIVVAARYLDGYDVSYISELFDMTETVVDMELRRGVTYVLAQCLDYEQTNQCQLLAVDEDIWSKAFELLFKRHNYQITGDVSVSLYNHIWEAICA